MRISVSTLVIFFIFLPGFLFAQYLSNPSFEGTPAMSASPPGWVPCGEYSTPDTQPINIGWNFSKKASEGNTYLGLVTRGSIGQINDNLTEAAGVQLTQPLEKNKCYTLSIDLSTFLGAQFNTGFDLIQYNNPGHLEIWASKASCSKAKLIWRSPIIANEEWLTFSFQFSSDDNYQHLVLVAQYADSEKKVYGNVLVDNFIIAVETTNLNLGKDKVICMGSEIQLSVPNEVESVLWWNNSTERNIIVSTNGIYWAILRKGMCTILDTVNITLVNPLQVDLGKDSSLCIGDKLLLDASSPYATYYWSTGSEDATFKVTQPGTYRVEVKNACNTLIDEIIVTYRDECCQISYPNVFTPNADTYNDLFEISTESSLLDFNLLIFNRWGQPVFSSTNINNYWDGLDQQQEISTGIYFIIAKIKCKHLNEELNNTYRGHVVVIK